MKKLLSIMFLLSLGPMSLLASNSIAKASGISDGILLSLMICIIIMLLLILKALAKTIEVLSKGQSGEPSKQKESALGKSLMILLLLGSSTFSAHAETITPTAPQFVMSDSLFWLMVSLIIFLAICIGVLFSVLNTLVKKQSGLSFEEEESSTDLLKQLKLTDNVPIEEEVTVMLDHNYDGIRELDNNLPPWWKYMFYATIVFSFIYIIRFHITGDGKLSHEEYLSEMAVAEEAKASQVANSGESVTEENVTYLIDAASIERGAAIYMGNCATCHGQLGEGGAGPNLTDGYWVHGGGIKNVFKTIKYGVPAKGMIAWQTQFNPTQIQKVSSYVLSLQGSNPPNGKDPQGEIYKEELKEEADSIDAESAELVEI